MVIPKTYYKTRSQPFRKNNELSILSRELSRTGEAGKTREAARRFVVLDKEN